MCDLSLHLADLNNNASNTLLRALLVHADVVHPNIALRGDATELHAAFLRVGLGDRRKVCAHEPWKATSACHLDL